VDGVGPPGSPGVFLTDASFLFENAVETGIARRISAKASSHLGQFAICFFQKRFSLRSNNSMA
jgi:hypothetical protein